MASASRKLVTTVNRSRHGLFIPYAQKGILSNIENHGVEGGRGRWFALLDTNVDKDSIGFQNSELLIFLCDRLAIPLLNGGTHWTTGA